jgi:hypothetical protein
LDWIVFSHGKLLAPRYPAENIGWRFFNLQVLIRDQRYH